MANGGYAPKSGTADISTDLDITLPTNQLKYFTVTDASAKGKADLTLTRIAGSTSTDYSLQVTMENDDNDGTDKITRICNGKICKTIVSGMTEGGTYGKWQATGV